MKKICCLFSVAFMALAIGCTDDEIIKQGSVYPVDENEVPFGAGEGVLRTGEKTETRTIYEVGLDESGNPQNYDKYTNLRVSWLEGDKVRVFSPEAPAGYQTADYKVTPELVGNEHYESDGFLVKLGENGIHWGENGKPQNFYAFYPGDSQYIKESLTTQPIVGAIIPVTQEKGQLTIYNSLTNQLDPDGDWKIINPDMEFCMMAAQNQYTPNSQQQKVELIFKPLITVFDIVVNGPKNSEEEYKILSVSLRSKSQNIVGPFTYTFTDDGKGQYDFPATTTDYRIATVDCMSNGVPTSLKGGQKLNLKFFLLPRDINSSELSISVFLEGGRVLTKSLGGNANFAAGKIIKIRTPKIKVSETNNWMSLIDDDVYFASQLSLPGAKHAYSYKAINELGINSETPEITSFGDVNTTMMSFFQTKNIKDLFNSGVRAFDIKVTTVNDYAEIYAAGKNTGIRLSDFLDELSGYLNPENGKATEAAVVTINYVSDRHSTSQWLDIVLGTQGVQEMNNAATRLKKVTSEITMGKMRGKIGIMVLYPEATDRAASTKYTGIIQNYSTSVQDYQGSHIDAGKGLQLGQTGQLYYQNLYQVNNPDIHDSSIDGVRQNVGLCPHYILKENYDNSEVSLNLIDTKKDLIARLLAHSQSSNMSKTDLFMNDCAGFCVVNDNQSTGWRDYANFEYKWLFGYYWDVTKSFNGVRDPNRLSGPVQTAPDSPNTGDTYLGENGGSPSLGQGGNTALFAEHINPALQDMIYQVVKLGRAPLGIIFMNYAGIKTVTVGGRTYTVEGVDLPSVIMTNNFKFDLMKKESTSAQ